MKIMKEIWKPVVGYEKYYEVSSEGQIRSLPRRVHAGRGVYYEKPGRIRRPVFNKANGYYMLFLNGESEKKCVYVHRVVAQAFCDNPQKHEMVNHINEIKTDNRAENLEWCSKEYNNAFNGKDQRPCKPIEQLSMEGTRIATWTGAREASAKLGIEYKNISAVCRGKRNSAGGYKWRFL